MIRENIKIDNVKEVYEFVEKCNKNKSALDIYAERDNARVQCSSLLGMFYIDPSTVFTIVYPDNADTKDFAAYITKFKV